MGGLSGLALAALHGCAGGMEVEREGGELGVARQALTASVSFRNGALPTTGYNGSTDATIAQAQATTNFGNSGTCLADGNDGGGVDLSCVLRWSLTGIPTGATVDSASITLQVINGTSNTYSVHELLRNFDESQVTWNRPSTAEAWGTAGALSSSDRGSVIGSVTGGTGAQTIQLNAAGVALVQSWVDGGVGAPSCSCRAWAGSIFAATRRTTTMTIPGGPRIPRATAG